VAQRKGSWTIMANEFEDEQAFREAVELELARLENMMYRLNDGFMVAPLRALDPDSDEYFTVGYAFQRAFVPAARRPDAEEPEAGGTELEDFPPEPVAVAAE
jgi:hypothetical protein